EPACHAAAPADLDHVAQKLGAGRLADEARVEALAALREPVQHLAGAVDRRPLLIPGDQQAERAGEAWAALVEERSCSGDKGGDGALHVDGAAAAQGAFPHTRGER